MKLTPTLVPAALWGRSVYNALRRNGARKEWEALRRSKLEEASNKCHYCNARYESRMVCHEIWDYDDRKKLATLTAFVMACQDCNSVLHLGKAFVIAEKYGTTEEVERQVMAHLQAVNGISKKQAQHLIAEAAMLFTIRSGQKWRVQIAPDLIATHPLLRELEL